MLLKMVSITHACHINAIHDRRWYICVQYAGEGKFLDQVWGPVTGQGVWGDRTNQEMRESYKTAAVVAVTKRRRLECLRHVIRMDQIRGGKTIFESDRIYYLVNCSWSHSECLDMTFVIYSIKKMVKIYENL